MNIDNFGRIEQIKPPLYVTLKFCEVHDGSLFWLHENGFDVCFRKLSGNLACKLRTLEDREIARDEVVSAYKTTT